MAEWRRTNGNTVPERTEAHDAERGRGRSPDDRNQPLERAGEHAEQNRRHDKAVRGDGIEDVDPDSADSEVDRDDTPRE